MVLLVVETLPDAEPATPAHRPPIRGRCAANRLRPGDAIDCYDLPGIVVFIRQIKRCRELHGPDRKLAVPTGLRAVGVVDPALTHDLRAPRKTAVRIEPEADLSLAPISEQAGTQADGGEPTEAAARQAVPIDDFFQTAEEVLPRDSDADADAPGGIQGNTR